MKPANSRLSPVWIGLIVLLVIAASLTLFFYLKNQRDTAANPDSNPTYVQSDNNTGTTVDVMVEGDTPNGDGEDDNPFTIHLSDGTAGDQQTEPLPVAETTPLSTAEIQAILARMPALQVSPEDQVEFQLPGDPIPPPRPGQTIEQTFPFADTDTGPVSVESGPLEILRYAPEGDVEIAPTINITFNQPMVPLATLSQLSQEEVPVVIEPNIPGTWQWVGTRTLRFNFDSKLIDRLPMATVFTVTIPAGTQSASGSVLENAVTWQFRTPPPSMTQSYPYNGPTDLEPFIFIAFDQRIDPQAVLENITVTAENKPVNVSLANEDAYAEDEDLTRLIENTPEGRWLVFQADEPLPKDAFINVTIGAETPSAEGPLTTTTDQSFNFFTYPPLKIEESNCGWYASNDKCYPLSPLYIRFNNPLDPDAYEDDMISIDPVIPGATVSIMGSTITISGPTEGSTTYRVTVDESLTDTFGQQLGHDERVTFRIGEAEPMLYGPDDNLITLDPAAPSPALSLYTINYDSLDVQIYAVEPADWPDFKIYLQNYARTDNPPSPPGRLVRDERINIDSASDTLTEVSIDLSEGMDGESGNFIVIAKPPKGFFEEDRYWETVNVWVQVTQIGIDAFSDQDELVVWTTSLLDGSPLEGITISSPTGSVSVTSDENGLARFSLNSGISYLIATNGEDTAFLPRSSYYWGEDNWESRNVRNDLVWYVFDDRAMYRPGEEVNLKGWMRVINNSPGGDVELVGSRVEAINYTVVGPQGNELFSGTAPVNATGGFDFSFTLPEEVNLGYAQIYLNTMGSLTSVYNTEYYHGFQIQEFRRPEFEVTARNESTGPYFVDSEATVAVEAAYYAGGPLPNAETNWLVTSSPTNYQPPNWSDFTFGTWTPWWYYGGGIYEADFWYGGYENNSSYDTFSGYTDASGNHYLYMQFENSGEPRPYTVNAQATVMDVNRQAWSGSTTLLVHPADLYVGMRTDRYFVDKNTPINVELIVTDLDGNAQEGQEIAVRAARMEWKYEKGEWQEVEAAVQECTATSGLEPVTCTFNTPAGGKYQITTTVTDELGRENQSQMTRWVSGGAQPPSREVEQETVMLIPDKETYLPGDVAEVLVQSPFSPAEGLLTVTRSGILYTESFKIEEETTTLLIPIEEGYYPNLNIQVDLVGAAARTDDEGNPVEGAVDRPAYATGQLTLNIPPIGRTLALDISPQETALAPGEDTVIDLTLKDADGNPVEGAELAVVVVDEAILALTNYQLADPLTTFYYTRPSQLDSVYSRSRIVLVDPEILAGSVADQARNVTLQAADGGFDDAIAEEAMPMEAPMADMEMEDKVAGMGGGEAASNTIDVRTDFNPLAVFAPEVTTDADGNAQVQVSLPDNLTRYRVMVVAVDESGKQFGSGEASITARLPLMVRPSASRFLNFGDQFEIPVVVQNQTDEEMQVNVVAQVGNLELTGDTGVQVTVPANDRVEVRFPGTTDSAGTAQVQVAAVSGAWADAATVSLPVYTPATTEAFATYGVVDEGAISQPLAQPEGVIPVYGGLEVTTSSTALQALTDAMLYLTSYPFDCSEQMASRILAIASLRDVLSAFEAEGLPTPAEMEASVTHDIEMLQLLQNYDGGFPYWRRGYDSIPFNTVHVALALQRARTMGFDVPEQMWQSVLTYLQNIEQYYPTWYSEEVKQTISAYALYVRMEMDDPDPEKANRLLQDAGVENLPLDATAWIWQVLTRYDGYDTQLESIRRHVNNQVVETAAAANFTTGYADDAYVLLHSDRRTDALLMDALIADNPQSDLIPKIVNGLLAHREQGRWNNTQENVFILLALENYFKTYENVEPDFVARMWLGEDYLGSSSFAGYNTDSYQLDVPMSYLVDAFENGESQDIILSKDGDGRLYYRLGLRYAPDDLKLDAADYGFVVQRSYEAIDDPEDVYQDADGVWHIRAGARVRVRVTMVADNRRYHVALVDHLPAGLEVINPGLAVSETVPDDPNATDNRYYWWWWTWYDHQNMRDERVEAFATLLWDGVYEYTYEARATMPGTFVVPPAKAEEMYSPEVFGRSASDMVIVE